MKRKHGNEEETQDALIEEEHLEQTLIVSGLTFRLLHGDCPLLSLEGD